MPSWPTCPARVPAWCVAILTSRPCVAKAIFGVLPTIRLPFSMPSGLCLKPGGKLLHAMCSVFPEENAAQIDAFLVRHSAVECSLENNCCLRTKTTVSIMRCCAKRFESLICGAALLLFALTAQAAEISILQPTACGE